MDFEVDRNTSGTGDPSLAEMTIKALRILKKNSKGYFLFVEGKKIPNKYFITYRFFYFNTKIINYDLLSKFPFIFGNKNQI